jgi:hypothetical protein
MLVPDVQALAMGSDVDGVVIRLSRDEALVLFDWLHRCEDAGTVNPPEHHGEQTALWNLCALLERELVEPFTPQYAEKVIQSRARLAGDAEDH